ncbi:hypothetical protein [Shinella sp. BYT-45]|uniref:hypothetical protein n=1 Tax=Shinella sp. BYT-45 TaxID=3377377 RepID=UPI0039802CA1
MVGRIIRTGQTFSADLPILINYDYRRILDQILALPSLRAFYDFSDPTKITKDGSNLVGQVLDLGPNALHLTASSGDPPTYAEGAMNSVPAVQFNGSNKLTNANLFSGSMRLTVSATLYATGADGTSRIFLGDGNTNNANFYTNQSFFFAMGGNASQAVSGIKTSIKHYLATMNDVTDRVTVRSGLAAPTVGALTYSRPSGSGNVGAWNDAVTTNRYNGYIGHLAILDEDVNANAAVTSLLHEYCVRRYRTAM